MISFKNKKGLGRGLSSLIGEGKVAANTKASISDLKRNKYQPRKKFDETSLNELSDSWIFLLNVVFPAPDGDDKTSMRGLLLFCMN